MNKQRDEGTNGWTDRRACQNSDVDCKISTPKLIHFRELELDKYKELFHLCASKKSNRKKEMPPSCLAMHKNPSDGVFDLLALSSKGCF